MIERSVEWVAGLPPVAHAGIVVGLGLALGIAIDRLFRFASRLVDGPLRWTLLEGLRRPMMFTAVTLSVYASRRFVQSTDVQFYLGALALSVLLVVWTHGVIATGRTMLEHRDQETLKFAPVLTNVLTFFTLIAALFILLKIWRIDVTPLLASAGIIGVVVGFAARDTINNFVSGVSLYVDRTFAVGDMIALPSGERGTVIDISIRSTTILTRDNVTVTIPNSEFNRQQVTNESAPQRHRRVSLEVTVPYGSDLEAVESVLLEAADIADAVIESPPPQVHYRQFGDSGIVAMLRCFIADPASEARAHHELVQAVDAVFRDESIEIPFPQRELSFHEASNAVAIEDRRDADDG
ncbi:MAG: mechanosensitive ion channel family protein [Halobacteriales archaeon]